MYANWLSSTYCSWYNHHAAFSPELVLQLVTSTQVTTNSNLRKFYIFCIFITFIFITFIPSPDTQGKSPYPSLSGCWGSAGTLPQWFFDPWHFTTLAHPWPRKLPHALCLNQTLTRDTHIQTIKTSLWMNRRHSSDPAERAQACSIREALDTR